MANITMKELLEAGVHFGHQTKRWNPKMKEYIFGERNGIYIIDLQKTLKMFKDATQVRAGSAARARPSCSSAPSARRRMPSPKKPNVRHVFREPPLAGRTLTNWVTVQKSVKRLKELDEMATTAAMSCCPRKK